MITRIVRLISCLLILSAGLFASADESASRTNTATMAVARPQEGPQKRFQELNERVKASGGGVELVFLGDSITQGWEGSGKSVWQQYYGDRKALNLGIGGDRTQHVLWRLENGNFEGLKPKVLVLMIGTNNSNGDDHSAGEILEGIVAVVRKVQALSPETKILVLGIFPRGEKFNAQRGKILQVNQAVAKLDDGSKVFYQDIGSLLIEANGSISKKIMPDYLHLSEAGYRVWAEAIEPTVSKLLGDSPKKSSSIVSVDGNWTWKMKGPNGEDVEGPLVLKTEGSSVTGEFRTQSGRTMKIQSGKLRDSELQLTVIRDRPQGGEMVYRMTGTVSPRVITGEVSAEVNGEETRMPWSARR